MPAARFLVRGPFVTPEGTVPTLRYVGPIDAIDLPLISATLERGQEFEVSPDQARVLLDQVGNYEPVDADAQAIAAELAAERAAAEAPADAEQPPPPAADPQAQAQTPPADQAAASTPTDENGSTQA
jgi:hypothetical protein